MRLILLLMALNGCATTSENFGKFYGKVVVEWLHESNSPDRKMKLLRDFAYEDPASKRWTARRGHIIDGASIPKPFWSFIGGPLEGDYRDASVVHDYYCDVKTEPWESVHRMFFNGLLASHVDTATAKIMYMAVYVGGPRWTPVKVRGTRSANETTVTPPPVDAARLKEMTNWITETNPSIEEIDRKVNEIKPAAPVTPDAPSQ